VKVAVRFQGISVSWWIFLPQPKSGLQQPGAPKLARNSQDSGTSNDGYGSLVRKSSTTFSWAEPMVDRTRACDEGTDTLKLRASLPLKTGHLKRKLFRIPTIHFQVRLLLVSGRVTNFRGEWKI